MSGSAGIQFDPVLSDVLSARSYLELAHEGFPSTHERSASMSRDNLEPLVLEESMEIEITCETHLQPQFGILSQIERPKQPQTQPEVKDTQPLERPVRKRGRPRLNTTKDSTAIEVIVGNLN
jgi:hypothetical protein